MEGSSVAGDGNDLQIWALAENALNKSYNLCRNVNTVSTCHISTFVFRISLAFTNRLHKCINSIIMIVFPSWEEIRICRT
jgi:hypothetical protein